MYNYDYSSKCKKIIGNLGSKIIIVISLKLIKILDFKVE